MKNLTIQCHSSDDYLTINTTKFGITHLTIKQFYLTIT